MHKGLIACAAAALLLASCGKEEISMLQEQVQKLKEENVSLSQQASKLQAAGDRLSFLSKSLKGVKARLTTNYGDIEVAFFSDKAPVHCFNFIVRGESGYYNGTRFHRVIPGFMIQGGDPNTKDKDPYNDGQGGPIVAIPHEFNDTHHARGILSMARVSDVSAGAGSQFFIMHGDSPQLDNQYTAFGEVVKGMEVVDKIASVKIKQGDPRLQDHPAEPVVIKSVAVYR